MMMFKKHIFILIISLGLMFQANKANGQFFFIGLEGGAVYSWFDSPKVDNIITSDGWGYNLGFLLRYGKKNFLQLGFDWTRSKNNFSVNFLDQSISEKIEFHNFDFSIKYGYHFYSSPMFKMKVQAGPFIGRSFLVSGNVFGFTSDDFNNPQFGMIGGIGFQFMNFVGSFEYSYHFTDLFQPVKVDDQEIKFGSHLQLISLKAGFIF